MKTKSKQKKSEQNTVHEILNLLKYINNKINTNQQQLDLLRLNKRLYIKNISIYKLEKSKYLKKEHYN